MIGPSELGVGFSISTLMVGAYHFLLKYETSMERTICTWFVLGLALSVVQSNFGDGVRKPDPATSAKDSAPKHGGSISAKELKQHDTEKSAWVAIRGKVYDVTSFVEEHPGGASTLMMLAGEDATSDFEAIHSQDAWKKLEELYVGPLSGSTELSEVTVGTSDSFVASHWQQVKLSKKITVSHNVRIFRFQLPSQTMKLGLPTGKHLLVRANVAGSDVMRPYTPITGDDTVGHVDLMVKVYFANTHADFPEGGKMSQFLESMQIGDAIDMKGPIGEFEYLGQGLCRHKREERRYSQISMIAAGSGLTPCFQVARSLLRNADDRTKLKLLCANQTPQDILLQDELEQLAEDHPGRFGVRHTVSKVPEGEHWEQEVGRVNDDMINANLFHPSEDTLTVLCGPPAMLDLACIPSLKRLGHCSDSIIVF